MIDYHKVQIFAKNAYEEANSKYDGKNYYTHIEMVEESLHKYSTIFKYNNDYIIAHAACSGHDLMEETTLTFNDIKSSINEEVALVILALTDIPEKNRLLKHLFTMPKTIQNHIALIVKLCDLRANGLYSKSKKSGMYKKYVSEYEYRRPIFKTAIKWHQNRINMKIVDKFFDELDKIFEYKSKI